MCILEKIFDGEFEPVNGRRPETPEYGALNKRLSVETEYWETTMDAEDFRRFETLLDILAEMGRHECFDSFKVGISLATEVIGLQKQMEPEE